MNAPTNFDDMLQFVTDFIERLSADRPELQQRLQYGLGVIDGYFAAGAISMDQCTAARAQLSRVVASCEAIAELRDAAIAEGLA